MGALDLPILHRSFGWDFMQKSFHHHTVDVTCLGKSFEDAGLLPNDVDLSYATSVMYNRENLLKLTEQELRHARQDLASVAPHAHFLRRLRHDDGLDPLPLDVVQSILNTAYALVFEYPLRCYEPDHPTSTAFRVRMGFETSVDDQRWTKDQFLKSLVYFAEAIDLTAADFRIEL